MCVDLRQAGPTGPGMSFEQGIGLRAGGTFICLCLGDLSIW